MSTKGVSATRGERLFIARRRKGESQIDAAASRGVSVDIYADWEMDRRTHDQPHQQIGELKPHEVFTLRRRRAGMTQEELAERLDCTRLWVVQMERGTVNCDRLREFWDAQGN